MVDPNHPNINTDRYAMLWDLRDIYVIAQVDAQLTVTKQTVKFTELPHGTNCHVHGTNCQASSRLMIWSLITFLSLGRSKGTFIIRREFLVEAAVWPKL